MQSLKNLEITLNGFKYKLQDKINEGGYSFIFTTNVPNIVCKITNLTQTKARQAYQKQKHFFNLYHHQYIIKFYGYTQHFVNQQQFSMIFLQQCHQNLFDFLQSHLTRSMPEDLIFHIIRQILQVVDYLHMQKIIHRDIKLQNILLDNQFKIRLIDFGSYTTKIIQIIDQESFPIIKQEIEANTTPNYRAPQMIDLYLNYPLNNKSDIFAVGIIAFVLAFKKMPFESQLSAVSKHYFIPEKHIYSDFIEEFLNHSLQINPTQRYEAKKLIDFIDQEYIYFKTKLLDAQKKRVLEYHRTLKETKIVEEKGQTISLLQLLWFKCTTQTEGWIYSFLKNQEFEIINLIVKKCITKKYKFKKIFDILNTLLDKKRTDLLMSRILFLLYFLIMEFQEIYLFYQSNANFIIEVCQKNISNYKVNQNIFEFIRVFKLKCILLKKYRNIINSNFEQCFIKQFSKSPKIINLQLLSDLLLFSQKLLGLIKTDVSMINFMMKQVSYLKQNLKLWKTYTLISIICKLYLVSQESDQIKLTQLEQRANKVFHFLKPFLCKFKSYPSVLKQFENKNNAVQKYLDYQNFLRNHMPINLNNSQKEKLVISMLTDYNHKFLWQEDRVNKPNHDLSQDMVFQSKIIIKKEQIPDKEIEDPKKQTNKQQSIYKQFESIFNNHMQKEQKSEEDEKEWDKQWMNPILLQQKDLEKENSVYEQQLRKIKCQNKQVIDSNLIQNTTKLNQLQSQQTKIQILPFNNNVYEKLEIQNKNQHVLDYIKQEYIKSMFARTRFKQSHRRLQLINHSQDNRQRKLVCSIYGSLEKLKSSYQKNRKLQFQRHQKINCCSTQGKSSHKYCYSLWNLLKL